MRATFSSVFAAIVVASDDVVIDLNKFTIEQDPAYALLQRFFAVVDDVCARLSMTTPQALFLINESNAFNARVDEEVRKAVEKFRERAEIVVRQECGGKCGGDRGCEISRKIMEIPTEPEVK